MREHGSSDQGKRCCSTLRHVYGPDDNRRDFQILGRTAACLDVVLSNDIVARKEMGCATPKGIVVCHGGVGGRLAHDTRLDVGEILVAHGSVSHADQEPCILWIVLLPVVLCQQDNTSEMFPQQQAWACPAFVLGVF